MPDEATLTRLATEFFGAMPGHEPEQVLSADLTAAQDAAQPHAELTDHREMCIRDRA